jgi:hypothetical protein
VPDVEGVTAVDLTLRTIAEDEVEAFLRTFRAVFGGVPDEQDIARARRRLEPDRSFVAVDDHGEVVAPPARTASTWRSRVAARSVLPGSPWWPCARTTGAVAC